MHATAPQLTTMKKLPGLTTTGVPRTKTTAVRKSVAALLMVPLAATAWACGNDIAESPADSSLGAFLATSAPELEPGDIGVIAGPALFHDLDHLSARVEFTHDERTLAYGVVPMSEGGLLAAALWGDGRVEGYANTSQLGGDYYDRPSRWDFIRNTDKAKLWIAYGECVDNRMGQTANNQCVVTMALQWNEDEEYWDAFSTPSCPDPR